MNHHDDPRALLDEAEQKLGDEFEAVMESLRRMTPQEITTLKLRAEAAELGHDAYILGLELLEQGKREKAAHYLHRAAQHHVGSAHRLLEELAVSGVMNPAGRASADAVTQLDPPAAGSAWHSESMAPGTLIARTLTGGIKAPPGIGFGILFGRDRDRVHVCVGEDDPHVSRHQGTLTHEEGQWKIRNTGRRLIRMNGRLLFNGDRPIPLQAGYTQLFISSPRREHLLEVLITDHRGVRPTPRHQDTTLEPRTWPLSEEERLALVVLGQRYLRQDPHPQPLSWRQTAAELANLRPDETWTPKKVEHLVAAVRRRMSSNGVPGLMKTEVGPPVGNALNDNLLRVLLTSTTLIPLHLELIDAF